MKFTSLASSSKANCNLVEHEGRFLMLDCGLSFQKLMNKLNEMGVALNALSACLITHQHKDHCKAVKGLLKRAVEVYCLKETAEALGIENHHRTHILAPSAGGYVEISGWRVIPIYAPHDVPCLSFFVEAPESVERMVYVTDCAYCPARFHALNIIALEINHDFETLHDSAIDRARKRRVRLNHMGLTEALRFIRQNSTPSLQEIHILHMSNEAANASRIISQVQGVAGCPVYICEE